MDFIYFVLCPLFYVHASECCLSTLLLLSLFTEELLDSAFLKVHQLFLRVTRKWVCNTSLSLAGGKFGSPYLGKAQQPQVQRDLFLPERVVFSCDETMVWLPVFVIFIVRPDVDACDCTRKLYGHHKRVCTGSWLTLGEYPLPNRGLKPASI